MRRFYCENCEGRLFEDLLIAERKKQYTRTLGRYAMDLYQRMTIRDVAEHTGFHWATAKAIDKKRLYRNLPSVSDLRKLRYLGIDEVSLKKRHRYLTNLVDLQTGRVAYVGERRSEQSIASFFKRLKRLKIPLKAFALDMWWPYVRAVRIRFPKMAMVYDAFHILRDYSLMLDALYAQEYQRLEGSMRKIIKWTRFCFCEVRRDFLLLLGKNCVPFSISINPFLSPMCSKRISEGYGAASPEKRRYGSFSTG